MAESGVDQRVEFTCSFQATSNRVSAATLRQQQRRPDVVWKRNGRKLPVKWLTSDQDLNGQETAGNEVRTRYVAKLVTNSNSLSADVTVFTLTIMKTQLKDDNATFSCLVGASLIDGENANKEELASESNQSKLRVYSSQDDQQLAERERNPITFSTNIATPIKDVHQTSEPTKLEDLPLDQRKIFTTSLNSNLNSDSVPPTTVKMRTLKETLLDLYEISKPTLLGFAILFLIGIIILLQWVYIKRKNRLENRYIKHHTYSNSSGSGGSGVSSAINGIDCADSNLENFMNRTISAQSAMSLCGSNGLNNGGGKKYRSYRDQLRKVAAVNDNSTDLVLGNDLVNVNGYFLAASQTQNNQTNNNNNNSHNNQTTNDNEPFFISSELPNLYNQSLAAREQARSLLQASEHMRSLGNLQVAGQKQQHKFHHQVASALQRFNGANQNGSHLNLPLSFVFKDDSETSQNGSTTNNARSNEQYHFNNRPSEGPSQMIASALWQPQINQQQFRQQQQQQFNHNQMNSQQMSENYQLINCNSVSPCSTSSSSSCAKNSQGNIIATKQNQDLNQVRLHKQGKLNCGHVKESNTSLNHYSTIEMNDDDDSRYEEVEGYNQNLVPSKRSSVHLKPSNHRNQDSFGVSKSSNFVRDNPITESQSDQSNHKSLRSSLISNSNSSTSGCGDLTTTSSTISNVTDVNPANKFNSRKVERQQQNLETKKTTGNLQTDKTNRLKYKDQLSPYAVSSICSSFAANQPPPVNSEAMRALSEQFDINHLLLGESSDRNSSTPPFDVLPLPPPPPSSQAG